MKTQMDPDDRFLLWMFGMIIAFVLALILMGVLAIIYA